ncbi:hypothetical protein AAG570_005339 [Ranatra chinensis]|uniref:Uncharacterized protein n=1 Tax=Ranatra chinensis TaxID=642074 RepID=A0ABD0YNR3_9HEMI
MSYYTRDYSLYPGLGGWGNRQPVAAPRVQPWSYSRPFSRTPLNIDIQDIDQSALTKSIYSGEESVSARTRPPVKHRSEEYRSPGARLVEKFTIRSSKEGAEGIEPAGTRSYWDSEGIARRRRRYLPEQDGPKSKYGETLPDEVLRSRRLLGEDTAQVRSRFREGRSKTPVTTNGATELEDTNVGKHFGERRRKDATCVVPEDSGRSSINIESSPTGNKSGRPFDDSQPYSSRIVETSSNGEVRDEVRCGKLSSEDIEHKESFNEETLPGASGARELGKSSEIQTKPSEGHSGDVSTEGVECAEVVCAVGQEVTVPEGGGRPDSEPISATTQESEGITGGFFDSEGENPVYATVRKKKQDIHTEVTLKKPSEDTLPQVVTLTLKRNKKVEGVADKEASQEKESEAKNGSVDVKSLPAVSKVPRLRKSSAGSKKPQSPQLNSTPHSENGPSENKEVPHNGMNGDSINGDVKIQMESGGKNCSKSNTSIRAPETKMNFNKNGAVGSEGPATKKVTATVGKKLARLPSPRTEVSSGHKAETSDRPKTGNGIGFIQKGFLERKPPSVKASDKNADTDRGTAIPVRKISEGNGKKQADTSPGKEGPPSAKKSCEAADGKEKCSESVEEAMHPNTPDQETSVADDKASGNKTGAGGDQGKTETKKPISGLKKLVWKKPSVTTNAVKAGTSTKEAVKEPNCNDPKLPQGPTGAASEKKVVEETKKETQIVETLPDKQASANGSSLESTACQDNGKKESMTGKKAIEENGPEAPKTKPPGGFQLKKLVTLKKKSVQENDEKKEGIGKVLTPKTKIGKSPVENSAPKLAQKKRLTPKSKEGAGTPKKQITVKKKVAAGKKVKSVDGSAVKPDISISLVDNGGRIAPLSHPGQAEEDDVASSGAIKRHNSKRRPSANIPEQLLAERKASDELLAEEAAFLDTMIQERMLGQRRKSSLGLSKTMEELQAAGGEARPFEPIKEAPREINNNVPAPLQDPGRAHYDRRQAWKLGITKAVEDETSSEDESSEEESSSEDGKLAHVLVHLVHPSKYSCRLCGLFLGAMMVANVRIQVICIDSYSHQPTQLYRIEFVPDESLGKNITF